LQNKRNKLKGYLITLGLIIIALNFRKIVSLHRGSFSFLDRNDNDDCFFPVDFRSAVVVLGATMMKMKSRSKKDEFMFFRKYYEQHFHMKLTPDIIRLFRHLTVEKIPVSKICFRLSKIISYEERLHLLHFLYGFACSDNFVSDGENRLIRLMGRFMQILPEDLDSVHAFYFSEKKHSHPKNQFSLESYYRILGVSPAASHDEIQKAYRKLAMKHHPDRVSHLGPEVQQAAKEKFQIIVDAYKRILKGRNL